MSERDRELSRAIRDALKRIDPHAFIQTYEDADDRERLTIDGNFDLERLVTELAKLGDRLKA